MSIALAFFYVGALVFLGFAAATVRFVVTQRFVARVRARTAEAAELQIERDRLYREAVSAEMAVARANDAAPTLPTRFMDLVRSLDKRHAAETIVYGVIATLIGAVLVALVVQLT